MTPEAALKGPMARCRDLLKASVLVEVAMGLRWLCAAISRASTPPSLG